MGGLSPLARRHESQATRWASSLPPHPGPLRQGAQDLRAPELVLSLQEEAAVTEGF